MIQTHHHFDHSVGMRAAVAQGLTVISRRGNEGIFREMTSHPEKLFPDALGRNPRPWTVSMNQGIELDTELIDEFCLENEKSYWRMKAAAPRIIPE